MQAKSLLTWFGFTHQRHGVVSYAPSLTRHSPQLPVVARSPHGIGQLEPVAGVVRHVREVLSAGA